MFIYNYTNNNNFLFLRNDSNIEDISKNRQQKIPKIIHYCWFGPKPLGPLEKKCIESWKKYLPDYQIMEWNNSHLHLIDIPYVKKAYENGRYAFVADVFRLYALKKYGGIYFDTDTEVFKNLDEFLYLDFFCEFENWNGQVGPAMTPLGAVPNHPIINDLYRSYLKSEFLYNDYTSINMRFKRYLAYEYDLKNYTGKKTVELTKGSKIFPYYYFINYKKGKSYAVHHYRASWQPYLQPRIKPLMLYKDKQIGLYRKINKMSDEFIWNRPEKIIFKIRITKNIYIVFTEYNY